MTENTAFAKKREFNLYAAAFLLSILAGALEGFVSWCVSGSVALLSDAIHIAADGLTYGALASVVAISTRCPDKEISMTKGGVWFSWVFLLIGDVLVFNEAISRIFTPREVLGGLTLFTAVIGLLLNWYVMFLIGKTPSHEHTIRHHAMSSHAVSDLLVSVGVIASALIMIGTGWKSADWIVALAVAYYLLWFPFFNFSRQIARGKWEIRHEHKHSH